MESYTSQDWSSSWYTGILVLAAVVALLSLGKTGTVKMPAVLLTVFGLAIVLYFVNEPIALYSDKYAYESSFEQIFEQKVGGKTTDSGFSFFTKAIKAAFDSVTVYFFIIASIYLYGYLKFIKYFFSKDYQWLVFIAIICSLGFYAYGTNTLRQGLALSVFLIAIVCQEQGRRNQFLIYGLSAVLIHKSLFIPMFGFWLVKKYQLKNNYLYFWLFCLLLTLAFGNALAAYLGDFLVGSDNRLEKYVTGKNETYKAGFKVNFLIYSIAPILYGLKVKSKINSPFYNRMLSLYIVVNAVWLLVIRIAFTDRFAYLSWFLIPFIFFYPLSVGKIFKAQNAVIALILVYLSSVCYIIAVK